MSEPAAYGRSYWEIVVHAFRKNGSARVALWISVAMVVVAILTPLLANDRPFTFYGSKPIAYKNSFGSVSRGMYLKLLTLPNRLRAETGKFEKKQCTWQEFNKRTNDKESHEIYETEKRLRERAEHIPSIRGRWIAEDVTLEEMVAEMTPTEIPPFEAIRRRILRDLPGLYAQDLSNALRDIQKQFHAMTRQLPAEYRPKAKEIEAKFREAVAGDYLTTKEDRKPKLKAAVDQLREQFDPEKVSLVSQRWYPLLDSLSTLDILFICAVVFAAVAFGPLTWLKLKDVAPIERRWAVTWAIAIVPALILAAFWQFGHAEKFETVDYKKGVQDKSIVMTSALWPPIRYRYDEVPEIVVNDESDRPPTKPTWQHPFGTDFMGRDLLSRMLWGSRISLSIGFVSAGISVAIGIVLGALAGYYKGWVDVGLSRVIEIMLCFPSFFIILAVVAFLPPSIFYVMLALGIFGWMGIARLQRGEFYRLMNQEFVTSARALGARNSRVMFRHVLPNALAPVLVAASFGIASAMLTESGLSFLGFGVQEPATSWGQILFTGREQLDRWWCFVIPGAAIFVAVTCYNLVGDGIRDAVDPRLKT